MTRNLILVAAAVVGLLVFSGAGYAFPISSMKAVAGAAVNQPGVHKVSFWGRPFPYRYAWSRTRACTRYVPVETSRGTVTRRVWVCGRTYKGGAVVSYRN